MKTEKGGEVSEINVFRYFSLGEVRVRKAVAAYGTYFV
jgi:hypothetical protein